MSCCGGWSCAAAIVWLALVACPVANGADNNTDADAGTDAENNAVSKLDSETDLTIDEDTGLVVAPGWKQVRTHCGACHSYALITAQRGDRAFWLDLIRWMQRTQNLWPLLPADEAAIVAYLGTHYDETEWGRRPPLAAWLMPGYESPESEFGNSTTH